MCVCVQWLKIAWNQVSPNCLGPLFQWQKARGSWNDSCKMRNTNTQLNMISLSLNWQWLLLQIARIPYFVMCMDHQGKRKSCLLAWWFQSSDACIKANRQTCCVLILHSMRDSRLNIVYIFRYCHYLDIFKAITKSITKRIWHLKDSR